MASKILKTKGEDVTTLDEEVNKALCEIESNSGDLKSDLKEFKFSGAKEIECQNKNAVVVFVPYRYYRDSKKVLSKLISELQKKFQKKQVIVVANRTILDKNFKRKGIQVRPRSRTLTNVHESILDDVIYPAEIVGKRTRVSMDGSKVMKLQLKDASVKADSKKEREELEEKLYVYSSVYRQLTNKFVEFTM